MEASRGQDWRRRGDPPIYPSESATIKNPNNDYYNYNYPAATSTSHQQYQHQQHTSEQFYKEEYNNDNDQYDDEDYANHTYNSYKAPPVPVAVVGAYQSSMQVPQTNNYNQNQNDIKIKKEYDQDDDQGDDDQDDEDEDDDDDDDNDDYDDEDNDTHYDPYEAAVLGAHQSKSSMKAQVPPHTTHNYHQNDVVIRCLLIKIGDYKLGALKKKTKKKKKKEYPGQINVTFSNGNGAAGGGFIHVYTNTPNFYDVVHKKNGKSCDFRIPLTSVVSFKLCIGNELKGNNLVSGFIQVSPDEGHKIRSMLNLTNEHFDPNCNDGVIERKYIKFSTPKNRVNREVFVGKISQIFGNRMQMIDRFDSTRYLNGNKKNAYVKRNEKRLNELTNELSFTCSSIHFGKYTYQGENKVFLTKTSNSISISMKHSSGQHMAMVRIPNRKKVIYKLAQYNDEDGQNKAMLFSNIRENKFAHIFGQAIGVNINNDFKPSSQADTARMYVVLFINTSDEKELRKTQEMIRKTFGGKCKNESGRPIIDEILKVTKHILR